MMAAQLQRLRLVRTFILLTHVRIVRLGTVSKAVPGWVVISIVGCGTFLPRNILPLEGRRRLAET